MSDVDRTQSEIRRGNQRIIVTDDVRLPSNIEAERSVLGSMLVHEEPFLFGIENVVEEDFHRHAHKLIFRAMLALNDRKMKVDFIVLHDYLKSTGVADEVGGPSYIAGLADGIPRSTNIQFYAKVIRDSKVRADMLHISRRISAEIVIGEMQGEELVIAADGWIQDLARKREQTDLLGQDVLINEVLADLAYRVDHKHELRGLDTGLTAVNELTGGWQPGDFNILAARPSQGKTALALNTAVTAARLGKTVAFFSLEMSRIELEYRLLSSMSRVMLFKLRKGLLTENEFQRVSASLEELRSLQIFIDDSATLNIGEIRGRCRRLRLKQKSLDLVVVDYLQLVQGAGAMRNTTRAEVVADISGRIKAIGKELKAGMLALSQLRRASEGKEDDPPKLSDLRESGALEQDADVVLMIHRKSHKVAGPTLIMIQKQRNGPTGDVEVYFENDIVFFRDARPSDTQDQSQSRSESEENAQEGLPDFEATRKRRHVSKRRW